MARPTDSTKPRTPRVGALVALSVVLCLLLPASALADAAVDEYSLGPVGGNAAPQEIDAPTTEVESQGKPPQQLGVLGENVPAQSPLEAAGAALWIGLGTLVLGGTLTFFWRRPRTRTGSKATPEAQT